MKKTELVLITVKEYRELLKDKAELNYLVEDMNMDNFPYDEVDYTAVDKKIDSMHIIEIGED